jgi:malonyl-CoA O-methyltransferase
MTISIGEPRRGVDVIRAHILVTMPLRPGTSSIPPDMMAPPRTPARLSTVRQQFDQRAARFVRHDALLREIERRMMERLDLVRLRPQRVLDVGCGAGASRGLFARRYPGVQWLGIDISEAMLRQAAAGWATRLQWPGRWRRGDKVCADAARLPLADNAVDLVHSNLMLHWHPQPHTVLPECKRVLRSDGLLTFSCFGPDTLQELRAACSKVSPQFRPMPFVDMHDFGDMLVAGGFAAPVMDTEMLTLTYATPRALIAEVAALGGNPRDDRSRGLPSTRQARNLLAALGAQRDANGRVSLTFEVTYGHAWKPATAEATGSVSIGLDTVRSELAKRRR